MIPRLRFFYGGSLHEWLHETPAAWFWAHARALPRLLAERSLTRVSDALASNGATLRPAERTSYLQALEQDTGAAPAQRRRRRVPPPASALGLMKVRVQAGEEVSTDDSRRRSRGV